VFAGAIAKVEHGPADGDEVELYSHAGTFIARGVYNSRSKIRVRLYSWSRDTALDEAFFRQRIQAAIRLRSDILGLCHPGQACRLVFSEADGLSGLIVDQYDRWLALQVTSLGMALRMGLFVAILKEALQPEGIYLRTERGIGKLEGLELQDGPLWGEIPESPISIEENGLRFAVNLAEGQKTGFYLDQRDNRRTVGKLAKGRRVLDAFCYTGGFSVYAARAGASSVMGVDVSAPAIALAEKNCELNGCANVSFVRNDVFLHLETLFEAGERFGLIVLDPPKFARARDSVEDALQGYRRIQTLALRLLEPNGLVVTCCCSGLINMEMLEALAAQLAVDVNRDIQLIERRGQAADHPVAVNCPESSYLKCLIFHVR
jgi:23S rRNA (cytosine1962-C5)-methyltransferase